MFYSISQLRDRTWLYLHRGTHQILLEQIERSSEEKDVLHQESHRQREDRKSTRLLGPGAGQEWHNGRCADVGHDRPQRAQDAKPRAPIAKKNESAEDRLGRRQKVARTAKTEDRQQPENDGAMADHRDQHLDGVLVPLLDAEREELEDHRGTN